MVESILIRKEFIDEAKISDSILKEWEELKIIKPSGYTEDKIPFYTRYMIERIHTVKRLIDMGYSLDDIQKIFKKVGFPKINKPEGRTEILKKHLTIGGLAERVGVSTRTIKHWEDKGIIEPNMRSEGGFRLYSSIYVYLCKLVIDLQLFGYTLEQIKTISDLFRIFTTISKDIQVYSKENTSLKLESMYSEIERLKDKMNLLKEGIQRWEDLLAKKIKDINSLKKRNHRRGEGKKVSKDE
jgi:DNA-binding transcriptional MerR regulator